MAPDHGSHVIPAVIPATHHGLSHFWKPEKHINPSEALDGKARIPYN